VVTLLFRHRLSVSSLHLYRVEMWERKRMSVASAGGEESNGGKGRAGGSRTNSFVDLRLRLSDGSEVPFLSMNEDGVRGKEDVHLFERPTSGLEEKQREELARRKFGKRSGNRRRKLTSG